MKGKKGPKPPVMNDPTEESIEDIIGAENIVDVDLPETELEDDPLPSLTGYTCADCTFRSKLLSEIQEHCNGTGHGGFESEEPVETATQAALFGEPGVITRSINVPMPEEELNERRARLAELYQEISDVKSAKKAADTDFNAQISAIDERMQAIARTLRCPTSLETVRCEWRIIDGENARGLYRLDTGELLEKSPLTAEDMALELEKAEAANAGGGQ